MSKWLERIVGPRFETSEIRLICLTVIVIAVAALVLSLPAVAGRPIFGIQVMTDFPMFYVAGDILNRYPSDRLYDLALQNRMYHDIRPGAPANSSLPFAYPPYFALILRPLARMPLLPAYLAWISLCALLYLYSA